MRAAAKLIHTLRISQLILDGWGQTKFKAPGLIYQVADPLDGSYKGAVLGNAAVTMDFQHPAGAVGAYEVGVLFGGLRKMCK